MLLRDHTDEQQRLKEVVLLLSNPSGDRAKGWTMLCEMAGLDHAD
jgi:hypothetical protein